MNCHLDPRRPRGIPPARLAAADYSVFSSSLCEILRFVQDDKTRCPRRNSAALICRFPSSCTSPRESASLPAAITSSFSLRKISPGLPRRSTIDAENIFRFQPPSFMIAAGRECRLNRRSPALARQQRRMQVQTGDARNFEHITRENLAVGHHDNHGWLQRTNFFDYLSIFDSRRLQNWYARFYDHLLDWWRLNSLGAPHRFVRLGDDCFEFVLS